jgi:signal transduction histidine kinase
MEEEDPEARNELLKKAVKALARQNDVIEDLITISRIQKKEIKLDLKITNLVDIIKRCIKDKEELASKKNVKITLEYKEIPYINADEKYLRHAILDLLDNAIKFNRDGGKVWIKVERKNSEVEVIIKDTGIGIPVDKLEEIFKPLTQLDPSTTRKYGGTGMGLTITKRIIELHGGTIKVKSKIGQGSEFSFSLKAAD